MSDLRKAAEMALEALEEVTGWQWGGPMRVMYEVDDAIQALRQALAQPEQKPVVEFMGRRLTPEKTCECWGILLCDSMLDPPKHTKLYTAPPKREWSGLSVSKAEELLGEFENDPYEMLFALDKYLREKNT